MRNCFAEHAGFLPGNGCDGAVRLYALAAQIQSLLSQSDWALAQCFPQTAQGVYLDYHAQTRGITRGSASFASGQLLFSASGTVASPLAIEAGTVCMTNTGIRFATTERAVIPTGASSVSVPAQAEESGVSGNAAANSITVFSALPTGIVSCTNPLSFTGGGDAENDDALRVRILDSFRRIPNGANAAYYEREAMNFPEVAAAKAVGRARGIGTVDVYVSTQSGLPSEELLERIRAVLQEKREIAVDLQVLSPDEKSVSVSAEISVREGYSFEETAQRVEEVIEAYFNGTMLGQDILTAQLGALIYGTEGVANYHLLSPVSDLTVGATELPILSSVTVSQIEE